MRPGRKRELVDECRSDWGVSIRRDCRVLEMDTSSYHYRSRRPDQAGLESRIRAICQTRVRYGYRRIHVLLQREGWQHFYKAPVSRQLCDFVVNKTSTEWALNQALTFCERHSSNEEALKLAFGALHWHTFAQLYEHEFERFDAQYKALDACYKLTCMTRDSFTKERTHAKRAVRLCEYFGAEPPEWVIPFKNQDGKETCELAIRRNALAHEALYGGQPLGFAHPADNGAMVLGLKSLVARILLSALGIKNNYTQSSATTRSMSAFECP